jgi:photosystem II stability/assembly factor-like uncharacterized protein
MVLVILASTKDERLSVLTPRPPSPPRHDEPPDVEALEALIEEARRRARRRRRLYGACALVIAATGLIGYFGVNNGGSTSAEVGREEAPMAASISARLVKPAVGIEGGSINALAVDSNENVFAGTSNAGVFKSANGGTSWRPLSIAPSTTRVDALAVAPGEPQTVYAGTGRGVFKSTDGGATWRAANGGLFRDPRAGLAHRLIEGYVYSLVVNPRDAETVYAGTWQRGLLKTTNGGTNWQRLAPRRVGAVALDPSDPETIYVGLVGGGRGSGISMSTDGGRTWHPAGPRGTNVSALAVDPKHARIFYAGTPKGLLKTSDGGNTWHAAGLESSVSEIKIDPKKPATLYAATPSGVHKSTDGGRTWSALDAGQAGRDGVGPLTFAPQDSTTLYAGTGAGVLKSTDSGRSWELSSKGMNGVQVEELAAPVRGSAYALVNSQGVYKRTGGVWRPVNNGLTTLEASALAVSPQTPATLYLATVGGVFRSTDAADSWKRIQAPPIPKTAFVSALAVDPHNPENVYAGTIDYADHIVGSRPGVFKSNDGGATWQPAGRGPAGPDFVSVLAIDPLDPRNVYVVGSPLGLLRSRDGGATWDGPVQDLRVESLALDPSKPATMYAGTEPRRWTSTGTGGDVFKSTDGGATWRDLDGGFSTSSVNAVAVNPHAPRVVYAGGDNGLFVTVDGGETWRRYQGDLGRRSIAALAFDPTGSVLYAGGARDGVVEVRLSRR